MTPAVIVFALGRDSRELLENLRLPLNRLRARVVVHENVSAVGVAKLLPTRRSALVADAYVHVGIQSTLGRPLCLSDSGVVCLLRRRCFRVDYRDVEPAFLRLDPLSRLFLFHLQEISAGIR